jgi:hypothetical protein
MFFLAVQWVLEIISKICLGLSWDFSEKNSKFSDLEYFCGHRLWIACQKAKYFHIFECQVIYYGVSY